MKYISTRSNKKDLNPINSAEAILQGMAADGGLFVPEFIPRIKMNEIKALVEKRYESRAVDILSKFLTDYTADELNECAELAYNWFDVQGRAPIAVFSDNPNNDSKKTDNKNKKSHTTAVLELWHGPTSAFKDMALQMLPQLMRIALKKTGETKQILILVATSGDTGKAALAGFADVPQTKIMVFYPDGGVSKIQRLQMVTQVGKNVNVTAVKGNFDDAQAGVKMIFNDESIRKQLLNSNVKLSSANSINWGRLVPQIVYYFSAYADLVSVKKINLGDTVNITVPTGNFGNILAAYYAKKMGLPVGKLICASNINNILTDFFKTGIYDRNRSFFKTITPSMDILISSNLERLLYHETNDSTRVKHFMDELNSTGKYEIDKDLKKRFDKMFYADYAGEDETKATIKNIFDTMHYLVDTHTAVAITVANKYYQNTGDKNPMIVASTASAYKFAPAVLSALGENIDNLGEFAQLVRLNNISDVRIPVNLENLKTAEVLHNDVCEKSEMADKVIQFAQK
ncbi:MAG: threonine synthase [Selenomonadaceae bacterium]|nr:threonine synthase [Selenomonadaceae bacterium]